MQNPSCRTMHLSHHPMVVWAWFGENLLHWGPQGHVWRLKHFSRSESFFPSSVRYFHHCQALLAGNRLCTQRGFVVPWERLGVVKTTPKCNWWGLTNSSSLKLVLWVGTLIQAWDPEMGIPAGMVRSCLWHVPSSAPRSHPVCRERAALLAVLGWMLLLPISIAMYFYPNIAHIVQLMTTFFVVVAVVIFKPNNIFSHSNLCQQKGKRREWLRVGIVLWETCKQIGEP